MRIWLAVGALNGFLGVVAGALGAHALSGQIGAIPNVFERAATYHQVHALALVCAALAGLLGARPRLAGIACILFQTGIVLFCGALYVRGATGVHAVVLAAPFGGLALMLGWLVLAVAAWPRRGAPGASLPDDRHGAAR